jgi:uncharacterized membrane protein
MWAADRTKDAAAVAAVARIVVIADFIFTASAVVVQPITGGVLVWLQGWPLNAPWLLTALALYLFTGACWLPVVAMQMEMRRLAEAAAQAGESLPARYHVLFRRWFLLGWPAFAAVTAIHALMLFKPSF